MQTNANNINLLVVCQAAKLPNAFEVLCISCLVQGLHVFGARERLSEAQVEAPRVLECKPEDNVYSHPPTWPQDLG